MEHAKLWKRILNEGIDTAPEFDGMFVNSIIRSPIIVDRRILNPVPRLVESGEPAAIPFDEVWIEGGLSDGCLWGCHVMYHGHKLKGASFFNFFAEKSGQTTFVGNFHISISDQGSLLVDPPAEWPPSKEWAVKCAICISACIDVLSLLACKNVATELHDNDPKQVRRAIKRHGGTPESYRYHTLVVRPPGASKSTPGHDIGIMPRHVCRGHFAEYGPEFNKGLLFGRYSGRFYIPPHLKGDKKNGIVEKDYEILAPQPT